MHNTICIHQKNFLRFRLVAYSTFRICIIYHDKNFSNILQLNINLPNW